MEVALRVFDGIDLQAAIQQFQPSLSDKTPSKKGRTKSELPSSVPQNNPASLVLEAIYLKSLSLQKLGKSIGTIISVPFVILILDYLINGANTF